MKTDVAALVKDVTANKSIVPASAHEQVSGVGWKALQLFLHVRGHGSVLREQGGAGIAGKRGHDLHDDGGLARNVSAVVEGGIAQKDDR